MKLLIIAACLVNYGDDKGGVHAEVGETVDVNKETAGRLVRTERALYLDKKDDPSKGGVDTASPAIIRAAKETAEAAALAAAEAKKQQETK